MNRREVIQLMTAGVAATGVEGVTAYALEKPVDVKSTLIVLKIRGILSREKLDRLTSEWEERMRGTPFENVKTVVLNEQIDLEIHQR